MPPVVANTTRRVDMPDDKEKNFRDLKQEAKAIPQKARDIVAWAQKEKAKGNKDAPHQALEKLTQMSDNLLVKGRIAHVDLRGIMNEVEKMAKKAKKDQEP